jgi:hypothetical protein
MWGQGFTCFIFILLRGELKMKRLVIVLAIMALFAGMATAKLTVATPTHELEGPNRLNTVFWFDDIESGVNGWTTEDFSAGAAPHFHVDTYMAYEGTYSWWCGTFDYDADGGYGNSWDDRLVIPTVDLTGATYPILTYAFRHDSETGYDYTYVQAESLGVFTVSCATSSRSLTTSAATCTSTMT